MTLEDDCLALTHVCSKGLCSHAELLSGMSLPINKVSISQANSSATSSDNANYRPVNDK